MRSENKYGPRIHQTWNVISSGSPYGTHTVRDAKDRPVVEILNRANRRSSRAQEMSRLERLVSQEEKRLSMMRRLRGVVIA